MNDDDESVLAYVKASVELAEAKAANALHVKLLGGLYAMPLPTPRAADSEASAGEVEGGTGRAAEELPGDGLQPEAQLLRREPELLEGASGNAGRAKEECDRIARELASEGAVK